MMKLINSLKKMKTGHAAAALFFALMLAVSIVGVSAWLTDASGTLANRFEAKTLEIDIGETDTHIDEDDDDNTNSYEITIGDDGWEDIEKDPSVIVAANEIDCWVFVTIEESDNFSTFMEYEVDTEVWTPLDGVSGVYYRKSESSPQEQDFNVLKDKTVRIKDTVTRDDINALTEDNYPKLNISGFAIQMVGFDSADTAWAAINA